MKTVQSIIVLFAALSLLFEGCTTVSRSMRDDSTSPARASFIRGTEAGREFSCSFVEFDGRGDYINRNQHDQALARIAELGETNKLLLVVYCHGWKNNSQSGDVVEFNSFLGRLAATPSLVTNGYRVHGLYLSWRGNIFKPCVDTDSEFYHQTFSNFNGSIVDPAEQRGLRHPISLFETLSYPGRLRAAENKVSGIPVAGTISSCASLVKKLDIQHHRTEPTNSSRVIVFGHSFGALLLERALAQTVVHEFTAENTVAATPDAVIPPFPLDFVLFVNSAAPSIYAKELRDFLTKPSPAFKTATASSPPVFISITSSADTATGFWHPIGNFFSRWAPSMQREYTDLAESPGGKVHQSFFYRRTPGHQPFLVNYWLKPVTDLFTTSDQAFDDNIVSTNAMPKTFLTTIQTNKAPFNLSARTLSLPARRWMLSESPYPASEEAWRISYRGLLPKRVESNYWIIRCGKEVIKNHNDVWSNTAMECYAGLFGLVEEIRFPTHSSEQMITPAR